MTDRFCVLGSVEEHVAKLRRLAEAGVDQFNIYLMNGDEEAQLETWGRDIIPAVRDVEAARRLTLPRACVRGRTMRAGDAVQPVATERRPVRSGTRIAWGRCVGWLRSGVGGRRSLSISRAPKADTGRPWRCSMSTLSLFRRRDPFWEMDGPAARAKRRRDRFVSSVAFVAAVAAVAGAAFAWSIQLGIAALMGLHTSLGIG